MTEDVRNNKTYFKTTSLLNEEDIKSIIDTGKKRRTGRTGEAKHGDESNGAGVKDQTVFV